MSSAPAPVPGPEPDPPPGTSEEFQRFQKFARRLLAVPKKEIDARLAKGKAAKKKPKGR